MDYIFLYTIFLVGNCVYVRKIKNIDMYYEGMIKCDVLFNQPKCIKQHFLYYHRARAPRKFIGLAHENAAENLTTHKNL